MANNSAVRFQNISATTAGFVYQDGERCSIDANAITWNADTISFQYLGADRITWLTIGTFTSASHPPVLAYLAPGQYRFSFTSATGVYAQVVKMPCREE